MKRRVGKKQTQKQNRKRTLSMNLWKMCHFSRVIIAK